MMSLEKTKDWIRENIPMLMIFFENKYIGMVSDRFASLAPTKQKQVIMGTALGVMGLVMLHLMVSYFGLYRESSQKKQSEEMVSLLKSFQKQQKEQSAELHLMERNRDLAESGALKGALLAQARQVGISPRMVQAEESGDSGEGENAKGDVKMKRATVKLQHVNLAQLKNFLQNVEFGNYNLDVSSIKITNDNKLRGYMDVELGVVAYLFGVTGSEEGA